MHMAHQTSFLVLNGGIAIALL